MDIKDLARNEENPTAPMVLEHPATGDPIGEEGDEIIFHIYSPYADKMMSDEQQMSRSALKQTLKARAAGKDQSKVLSQTADELIAYTEQNWLNRIAGWENIQLNGEDLECTEDNKKVIAEKLPFAKRQVNEFYEDLENFFSS